MGWEKAACWGERTLNTRSIESKDKRSRSRTGSGVRSFLRAGGMMMVELESCPLQLKSQSRIKKTPINISK